MIELSSSDRSIPLQKLLSAFNAISPMPPPIGDDELKLKQRARRRLIGAAALLAALVLILPMVLDNEPKRETSEIAVHIPAPQQTPTNTDLTPSEPETKPEPQTQVAQEPVEAIKPPLEPAEIEAPPPAPIEKPRVNAADHGFFVQVGVFSKSENAKSVRSKLSKKKLAAFSEQIKTSAGTRTRIRVGPFSTRADAEEALTQVKRAGEKSAVIVSVDRSR